MMYMIVLGIMKAIVYTRYGSTDVLRLRMRRTPIPGHNDILIKVCAAAVTSADCAFRKGEPAIARLFSGIRKPKKDILGTEFSGTVEKVGKNVMRFKKGAQVYAATGIKLGAHAEYVCMAADDAVAEKPDNMSYEGAAAICEGTLTALPFLREVARIKEGDRVLINGASGSVGTAAVQIAKYFGASVAGVCSTTNVAMVKSLGADIIIDYKKEDFTQQNRTYDIIFDAVGKSSYARCKNVLTKKGVYLTTVLSFAACIHTILGAKSKKRRGVFVATGLRPAHKKREDLVFIKHIVEEGKIKAVIDATYAFSLVHAVQAHKHVEAGHKKGNVLLVMSQGRSLYS